MEPSGSSPSYTHEEHLDALRLQIKVDPISTDQLATLNLLSLGDDYSDIAEASEIQHQSAIVWAQKAVAKMCAANTESAFYSLLALGIENDPQRLSLRDLKVLRYMASGMSGQEIAEQLGYTGKARRNLGFLAIKVVREKLGARNNVEAVRLGYRFRLLNPVVGDPPLPEWPE